MSRQSLRVLAIGCSLALFSLSANAVQPGVYFGAGFGTTDDQVLQETDNGVRVFGGINITPNFGLEVAYIDLGEYVNGTITQEGTSYEIVGYLPLTRDVDFYGKFGLFNWEVSNGITTNTGDDTTYAVGINVRVRENISFRGEWQTFLDVDGGDVDMLSANISVNF